MSRERATEVEASFQRCTCLGPTELSHVLCPGDSSPHWEARASVIQTDPASTWRKSTPCL